ncbi:LPO_1073/Vpar_1526 family protein [Streptomyces sp. NPDC050528]|uniref:LPO_1073/Vpar_1526 family protein n=1 Tax=Streptomyces sp. NPDC050528 TaxID=3365623 RepID=UPI003794FA54
MKWRTQKQTSGDNSKNLNVGRDAYFGLSYQDVKVVAKDAAMEVFRDSFTKLTHDALSVAVNRAEELTENFLSELRDRQPEGFKNLGDPGVQSAIFDAQATYAKTGDAKLADMLVGILVDRVVSDTRDVTQLSLETALRAAQSISGVQVSLLTCNFLVQRVAFADVETVEDASRKLIEALEPFQEDLLKASPLDPDYLVGVGCLISASGSLPPEHFLGMNYPGLFSEGFTLQDFPDGRELIETTLVRPHAEKIGRYNLRVVSKADLEILIQREHLEHLSQIADRILTTTIQQDRLILRKVLQVEPSLAPFFDTWGKLGMSSYLNTPTAIVIAHANTRRIAGENFKTPLSHWIP